ncbi:MAG TPA: hypothetical protein VK864_19105 [Longimicrobiales bacterium]|nr:hypothetical protein [Longimicrobiales bacterium]
MYFSPKLGAVLLVALAAPTVGRAQGISVSPMIGAYAPGGSFRDLQDAAENKLERAAALGLGANVEFGFLRGSVAYATGATISRDGINGESEIGDGNVLVGAVDLVWRPLPRLIVVQPYLLGGAGYKKESYSFDEAGFENIGDGENTFVLHVGVGADIGLGPFSLVAEITDFIGRDNNDDWKVHDGFGMVGLKFRLF